MMINLGFYEKQKEEITINRDQKRRFKRIAKRKGLSQNIINTIADRGKEQKLEEGQKVKLRYSTITKRKDYSQMQPRYRDFVESHKDDIFTVEYDEKIGESKTVICLAEDTSEAKWLWWTGDLEIVK